jgi:hypothetical protein
MTMSQSAINLNENHCKAIFGGVQYVDHLLTDALAKLTISDNGEISHPVIIDATPEQREGIARHVARLRGALRGLLKDCDIPLEPPSASGLWSLCCNLAYVQVALEELDSRHLRGYGEMEPKAAAGLDNQLKKVMPVLEEFMAYAESCAGKRSRGRTRDASEAKPASGKRKLASETAPSQSPP